MATAPLVPLVPGVSLGPFALGASLRDVLTVIKNDSMQYPAIDLYYSQSEPVTTPVIVTARENGLRLRFDGADQRLRLIEVMDFAKLRLAYKGSELIKGHGDNPAPARPVFKRVYSLFGPSYPGEYMPPKDGGLVGTYVLSWQGVALTFPIQDSAWSSEKDHVSMLGSHVASPATHLAVFEGQSWADARRDLFVRQPAGPRQSGTVKKAVDTPAELELATVLGDGRVEFVRSQPDLPFTIVLNETIPQDLVTELGPPDAKHKRDDRSIVQEETTRKSSMSRPICNGRTHPGSAPSSYSSTGTDTFDTEFDNRNLEEDTADRAARDEWWCYFSHGLDILVGLPIESTDSVGTKPLTPLSYSPHMTVLKVVIHGNVPGSYAFNRHRRLRWSISLPSMPNISTPLINSEQQFDADMKPHLLEVFANGRLDSEMARGKVVNRSWSGSGPSDSSFFLLRDDEQDLEEATAESGSEEWLANSKLYAFPGLVFEVLENGAVSALTVY